MSDKEKRELYDRYGLEGVKNGGGGAGGFEDIFEMFSGGRRRGGGRKQKKKVKPTVKEVSVTLEDVYNGKDMEVTNKRTVLCPGCDGQGGANVSTCDGCGGHGVVMKTAMIGPGMYQRMQAPCDKCRGKGKVSFGFGI